MLATEKWPFISTELVSYPRLRSLMVRRLLYLVSVVLFTIVGGCDHHPCGRTQLLHGVGLENKPRVA